MNREKGKTYVVGCESHLNTVFGKCMLVTEFSGIVSEIANNKNI